VRTLAGLVPVSLLPGRLADWQSYSNHGAGSDSHQWRDEEGGTPPAPLVSFSSLYCNRRLRYAP